MSFNVMDMLNTVSKDAKVRKWERISINNIVPNVSNVYPITDLEELVDSISTIGLEQNLVVKETEIEGQYLLITGHRRYAAINYIFDHNIECKESIRNELLNPMCCVVSEDESNSSDPDEEELITHYRLHETNINVRRMTDSELLICIEDYVNTVNQLKDRHVLINGKEITGTTRELVSSRFGLSSGKTQQALAVMKSDNQTKEKVVSGKTTINKAYSDLKKEDPSVKLTKTLDKCIRLMSYYFNEEFVENMNEAQFHNFCASVKLLDQRFEAIKEAYAKKDC